MLQRIHPHQALALPLWNAQSSKLIEQAALATPQHPSLMQRAGHTAARLAFAIAPHARQAWVLCGPGNNGGDGLEAAHALAQRGLTVWVHWLGKAEHCSPDTLLAWQQARQAPLHWLEVHHTPTLSADDVVIDALLGLGQRAQSTTTASPVQQLLHSSYGSPAHSLAIDIPTGLDTDHGIWHPNCRPPDTWVPSSRHTLSLLTLKPGLFTGDGRDACGDIWWETLNCDNALQLHPATAWLNAAPAPTQRPHNSHKGSFGDVLVIGGAPGMTGAAILAASTALHHGAGRTLLHLLDTAPPSICGTLPDVMQASTSSTHAHLAHATVVCGCGGGTAIAPWLAEALTLTPQLVLDADALNTLAHQPALRASLQTRRARGQHTILTPHPLEAARLLGCTTAEVQAQRLVAAQTLADQLQSTIVLKGSGSIIASPGHTPHINPTGNARLAIGGTGDVLAGLAAARWRPGTDSHSVACHATWEHGALADQWPTQQALTASALAQAQLTPFQ